MFARVKRLTPKQKGEILAAFGKSFELLKNHEGYFLGHYREDAFGHRDEDSEMSVIFVLVRCECGHIFAVRPDAPFANCPKCGETGGEK